MPDGIRVLAIFLVMWFHIWQQSWLEPAVRIGNFALDLSPAVRTGYLMVDVLLMLSGFLLFLPVARGEACRALPFYKKRLIRIVPCYYLSVLVMLFCFALPNGEYLTKADLWRDLLSHLTFTHTFFYQSYVATKLNVVLWTVAVEMQFYLLFPFLARAFRRAPVICYLAMVALALLFRSFAAAQENVDLYLNQLPALLDVFANGMLAAWILSDLEKRERTKASRLLFAALLMFAFLGIARLVKGQYADSFPMEARKAGQLSRRFELSAFAALALISGESSFLFIRRVFSNPVTRFLSRISYNAYIWHQVLSVKLKAWKIPNYISDVPNSSGEQPWQTRYTLLCFFLSILLAALVTYCFEIPIAQTLTKLSEKLTILRYNRSNVKRRR